MEGAKTQQRGKAKKSRLCPFCYKPYALFTRLPDLFIVPGSHPGCGQSTNQWGSAWRDARAAANPPGEKAAAWEHPMEKKYPVERHILWKDTSGGKTHPLERHIQWEDTPAGTASLPADYATHHASMHHASPSHAATSASDAHTHHTPRITAPHPHRPQ